MAKVYNCVRNGKEYYRINRKVGEQVNSEGKVIPVKKVFYGDGKTDAENKWKAYMQWLDEEKVREAERLAEEQRLKEEAEAMNSDLNKPLYKVMDDWIEVFFNNCELSESTKALYVSNYKLHFRDTELASKKLGEVTALMIQKFYNECDLKNSNLKSINKLLLHFYNYCELNGICGNVIRPVKVPKKDTADKLHGIHEIDVWDDDDLKKVINALSGTTMRFLVVLAVNSGCRISELMALTYNDIDGNKLIINKQTTEVTYGDKKGVRLSNTKTACSNRVLYLSDEVVKEFKKHQLIHKKEMVKCGYRTDLIFSTNTGNYHHKRDVTRSLERLYKRIGVPRHKFHSFRHTFATNLSRAGVPIEQTSKLMGHSGIDVTSQYYINIGQEEKLDAVERIVHFSLGRKEA